MKRLLVFTTLGVSGLTAAGLVSADTASAPANETAVLEKVTVTAQRREESAQDVSAALTVISGDKLRDKGVSNILGLQYEVPNLEIDPIYGSDQAQFRIRGVGLKDYGSNNASTVGVYVDQTAYPFAVQTQGLLFDLERVEVLRGPQGTLYGRNSTGGAVNFISRKPTREFESGFTASYGSFDAKTFEGYVSGPLNDALRSRIAFSTQQGGAWQHNRDTGEALGDKNINALRAQFELEASKDLNFLLIANLSEDKSDSRGLRSYLGVVPNARGVAGGYSSIPADTDYRATGWSLRPEFARITGLPQGSKPQRDNNNGGLSLTANWDLGNAKLTSVTSSQNLHRKEFIDWDGTIIPQSDEYFDSKIGVFSQEFRLTSPGNERFNWLTGLYYSREKLNEKFYSDFTYNLGYATLTSYRQEANSLGVFGQADYALNDRYKLVFGLRHENEDRDLKNFATTYVSHASNAALVGTSTFAPVDRSLSSSLWSGKLALEYELAPAQLLYTSVSRGVKSGGFTAYNSVWPQQTDPVKPEILTAYEAGFKSDVSSTFRLNGALFYYDYRDQQLQSTVYVDPTVKSIGRLVNVPRSEIFGTELEALWKPVSGLSISQYVGFKKGTYKEFRGVNSAASNAAGYEITTDYAGQDLPIPQWSYGGSASYKWSQQGYRFTAEGDYAFHDVLKSTTNPAYNTPAYWLANARFAVAPIGASWEVGLWVRNLFDKKYDLQHGSFLSNAQIATSGLPRTAGIQLNVAY
ncbi:TonB-dependent receptor [Rhodocyclus tenuis]|uniref:TonB-dependent receptor n=1 Tax=Rhodocyclus gracilis TaxID=2929842 RepID=A0ABX0WKK2_9RHOO|nr:TonB-dependent receptor [Rhodocyclus gracilis]